MNLNPLSGEDYKQIETALMNLQKSIPLIHALEACGEDCGEDREQTEAVRKRLESLREEFFSEGKPKHFGAPSGARKGKRGDR